MIEVRGPARGLAHDSIEKPRCYFGCVVVVFVVVGLGIGYRSLSTVVFKKNKKNKKKNKIKKIKV